MNTTIKICLILGVAFCFSASGFSQELNNDFPVENKINSYIYLTPLYIDNTYFIRTGFEINKNRSTVFGGFTHGKSFVTNSYSAGTEFGYKYSFLEHKGLNLYLRPILIFNLGHNERTNETRYNRLIGGGAGIEYNINRFSIGTGFTSGYGDYRFLNDESRKRENFVLHRFDWLNLRYRLNR